MRAIVLPLLAFGFLGCMADPPPAAPAEAAAKPARAPEGDGFADVTTDDCRAWADQFASRIKEATHRRIDECAKQAKQAGVQSPHDAEDEEQANAEAERLHALIVDQCGQQVGAAYDRKDAACYMGAKKMEDWNACRFRSAFFSDYKSVAKNHQKLFDMRCQRILAGTATKTSN